MNYLFIKINLKKTKSYVEYIVLPKIHLIQVWLINKFNLILIVALMLVCFSQGAFAQLGSFLPQVAVLLVSNEYQPPQYVYIILRTKFWFSLIKYFNYTSIKKSISLIQKIKFQNVHFQKKFCFFATWIDGNSIPHSITKKVL